MMEQFITHLIVSAVLIAILLPSGMMVLAWFNLFPQPEWMRKIKNGEKE